MKYLVFGLIAVVSCRTVEPTVTEHVEFGNADHLIFGHFYGFCVGEGCIEIFKLEKSGLSEDSLDTFPRKDDFYDGNFIPLDSTKYNLVKYLMDDFPENLLSDETGVFGCPDCADGGGLYIEYYFNGIHKSWIIDQVKSHVPVYLHDFMDEVNNKIYSITN